MSKFAKKGSQRWLQIAIDRHPDRLLRALRKSGAVPPQRREGGVLCGESVLEWSYQVFNALVPSTVVTLKLSLLRGIVYLSISKVWNGPTGMVVQLGRNSPI